MSIPFEVEELRDNYYLVRGAQDGELAETRFYVDPDALDGLGLEGAAGADVVRATVDFLLQRQRIDDLPTQVDIQDVAAAYEDFIDSLRASLGASEG